MNGGFPRVNTAEKGQYGRKGSDIWLTVDFFNSGNSQKVALTT